MRRLQFVLWPAGLVFGVAAEWVGRPELRLLDAAAGFALLFLGLVAWVRRPESRVGAIMAGAGFAWFLGSLWEPAVFLHRAVVAQLLVSYPTGRLGSRVERGAVVAAYVYACAYPIAGNDLASIVFAIGLVALSAYRYEAVSGVKRRARLAPLLSATAFGLVLALGSLERIAGLGGGRALLFAYDLVVVCIAGGLFADLLWGRWSQAAVTGLVVDLGEDAPGASPLRDRLARTLGDPSLVIGYWLPEEGEYVDEAGRRLELPARGAELTLTPIEVDGERVALLVHDTAVLADPRLLSAVASATRLAVSNARLQAEVRARVAEVEASRRRIVLASDRQRQRFERELREGAERRLAHVTQLLTESGGHFSGVRDDLAAARAELREFAQGIRPRTLTEHGLQPAIEELAARSPIPVEVVASLYRLPPVIETAAFFVCSEALANAAKHAEAESVTVNITSADGRATIEVSDDGTGGADPALGSGLHGLADRVEALGGSLSVESPQGRGTRVRAAFPVEAAATL
jgi:signal transduction histidine kinase